MTKMRPRKTREQWAAVIDQQAQSGLSINEFCHQQDIGFASFGVSEQSPTASAFLVN